MDKVSIVMYGDLDRLKVLSSKLDSDEVYITNMIDDEDELMDEITYKSVDVLLVVGDNINGIRRVTRKVYLLRPRVTPVVVLGDAVYTPEMISELIGSGAQTVMNESISKGKLITTITGVVANERVRLDALESSNTLSRRSELVTLFRVSGGLGTTSLACNLAINLAKMNYKVALLDYNVEFGDVGYYMNLDRGKDMSDMLEESIELNIDSIRRYMHISSDGVHVLKAPERPEFKDSFTDKTLIRIVDEIRNFYDYVIVDTEPGFSDVNLDLLDITSHIIYLVGNDTSSLLKSKKGLNTLDLLLGGRQNRVNIFLGPERPSRVTLKDAETVLGFEVDHVVPYVPKEAVESLNTGRPISVDGRGKLGSFYESVAVDLVNGGGVQGSGVVEKNSGLFGKIFGK